MLHQIPTQSLGPRGEPMAHAVQTCVHCGFCLPTCPTYVALGEEMDSPRGRIFLMKEALEGRVELEDALPYLDRCLGCLGCVTACPSGVAYGELITPFRAHAEERRRRSPYDRLLRWFVLETLSRPRRFRWGARLGRIGKLFRRIVPGRLGDMLDLLPDSLPAAKPLPEIFPAEGPRRARVALVAGCAQQVLEPEINWATLRVLSKNGVEVVIPRTQGCCGALAAHTGDAKRAARLARNNLLAFPKDVDAILSNAAGCGSGMQEYGLWLIGEPDQAEAEAFSRRVRDVSVFLDELGLVKKPSLPKPMKVAYHDACHLAHAQGVRSQPRSLLTQVENLTLLEIPDGEICCGSAGTYNLEQPDIARQLGQRKAETVLSVRPDAVATGNIGCMTQLRTHLAALARPIPVYHTMELLDLGLACSTPAVTPPSGAP